MDVVSGYLNRLKISREKPSLNYLQRLIQHHLSLIPYETFSKFYYYNQGSPHVPDFELFVQHLEDRGWGGTCYSLNINFARLLEKLGYTCAFVRVLPGHVAIMVTIENSRYYVDVGYGSPMTRPIELESRYRHVLHGFGEEIIFTNIGENKFLLERRANGKTFVTKEIQWVPLKEEEIIEEAASSFQDCDSNITMRRISAVRFQGNNCYFLRDETLKVMNYRDIRAHHFKEKAMWMKAVVEAFQVDEQGLEESIAFLEQRGIELFEK